MPISKRHFLTMMSGGGAAPSSLLTGLVSRWSLDESSGTRTDSVGANHLSDTGSVGSEVGLISNAAVMVDASNQKLAVASPAGHSLSPGAGSYTCAGWFKKGPSFPSGNRHWVNHHNQFRIFVNANTVTLYNQLAADSSQSGISKTGTFAEGTWHFVCFGRDASTNQRFLVVDDLSKVTGAFGALKEDTTNLEFRIGGYLSIEDWHGSTDEVSYWNRVLTDDEISQLYNGGAGLAYPF